MIKYAISDPKFFNPLDDSSYSCYQESDYLLFRNKKSTNYDKEATIFIHKAKSYSFLPLLHQDYKLAHKLKAFGVHLTSLQFDAIQKAKELKLFTVISTHSFNEVIKAQELGADAVTFSPIFPTPNKGEPKGIDELRRVVQKTTIKVIALGGIISSKDIELLKEAKPWGFASIRYFIKNC